MGGSPTTVLVVDDHVVFAQALAMAVDATADMRCTGTASSLAEALPMARDAACDVCVLDLTLPDAEGADAVTAMVECMDRPRVIVLTGSPNLAVLAEALSAGAAGVLQKDASMTTVLDAIRNAPENAVLLQRSLASKLIRPFAGPVPGRAERANSQLSRRDSDVLQLLAAGLPPKAIAQQLGITVSTTRGYVKRVLIKLGAHSQLEAVSIARRDGLLE